MGLTCFYSALFSDTEQSYDVARREYQWHEVGKEAEQLLFHYQDTRRKENLEREKHIQELLIKDYALPSDEAQQLTYYYFQNSLFLWLDQNQTVANIAAHLYECHEEGKGLISQANWLDDWITFFHYIPKELREKYVLHRPEYIRKRRLVRSQYEAIIDTVLKCVAGFSIVGLFAYGVLEAYWKSFRFEAGAVIVIPVFWLAMIWFFTRYGSPFSFKKMIYAIFYATVLLFTLSAPLGVLYARDQGMEHVHRVSTETIKEMHLTKHQARLLVYPSHHRVGWIYLTPDTVKGFKLGQKYELDLKFKSAIFGSYVEDFSIQREKRSNRQ